MGNDLPNDELNVATRVGQHYDYLLDQLKQFKASTRGDFDGTVTCAAQALTPADVEVLAQCLSTLVAP